jgi:hypothetical protein
VLCVLEINGVCIGLQQQLWGDGTLTVSKRLRQSLTQAGDQTRLVWPTLLDQSLHVASILRDMYHDHMRHHTTLDGGESHLRYVSLAEVTCMVSHIWPGGQSS